MNTVAHTLPTIATEARGWLARKTVHREGNKPRTIMTTKDDAPEWVKDLCREAHDHARMLPDDFRYECIAEVLDLMAESDGSDDSLDDARNSLEADIYTSELTDWLGSHNDRAWYVDEAVKEYGQTDDTIKNLMMGQVFEKQEVFDQVLTFLRQRTEDTETDE